MAVLKELGALLAAYIMEQLVLKTRFNEWGALLLYQEVTSVSYYALYLLYLPLF